MPQMNIEAEQNLLGCILVDNSIIKEVRVRASHFVDPRHQAIFKAMREADSNNEAINLMSMVNYIPDIMIAGGTVYLTDIQCAVASTETFRQSEKYIIDAWKLRQAEMVANQLKEGVQVASDTSIITETISKLAQIDESANNDDFDLKEMLMEVWDEMEQDRGNITGIDTGYYALNALTSGWQDEDLIVIAARPSMGKTAFVLNEIIHACRRGVVVTLFSLEMPKKSIIRRIMCAIGPIDATKMRNPKRFFGDDEWSKATVAIGEINSWPLYIYDDAKTTMSDIYRRVRKVKRKYPDKKHMVVVDYLQLIDGSGRENRAQEVGEISKGLKQLAREFKMPVVALSQLTRSVEQRQDKRPMMSDIRESGQIEQDSDLIMFLYRDDYYNKETENKNVVEVIIAKQRNGPTGTVELAFLKEYNKFVSVDHRFRQTTFDEVANG